jgi:hypothetical protein
MSSEQMRANKGLNDVQETNGQAGKAFGHGLE